MSCMYQRAALTVFLAILLAGCSSERVATIRLTGTPGAAITGYYVQNGTREPLTGTLPLTLEKPGMQIIAVRKVNKEDDLGVAVYVPAPNGNPNSATRMSAGSTAGRGEGIRIVLQGGPYAHVISPEESLEVPQESIGVIVPYWYEGQWVIDDARYGLKHEPYVRGVPEMIDALVKDIPNAKQGFRLTSSPKPFPGYQAKITWVRAEDGGNVYRCDDPPMEGWFCPELYNYFTSAPKEIYLRADPK